MTLEELRDRVLRRVGEATASPAHVTAAEATRALNRAQRMFAFLTLCLREQRSFVVTPGNGTYRMLAEWSNWVAPLRLAVATDAGAAVAGVAGAAGVLGGEVLGNQGAGVAATGAKLLPATVTELAALDASWMAATGTPAKYALLGWDLVALYPVPSTAVRLLVTYARMPRALAADDDSPDIPETDHECLADYAIAFIRAKQGGRELARDASRVERFFETVKDRAAEVRATSLAQRFDTMPFEVTQADLSRAVAFRKDAGKAL